MPALRRVLILVVIALATVLVAPLRGETASTALKDKAPKAGAAWGGPFFFFEMSDSHIGWPGEPGVTGFEKALAQANRLKPAFVVVTGDLIDAPCDRAMIARFKSIAAKLDKSIPLYLVPGNHDVRDTPTPESLAFYRAAIGRDYYSLDVRGCHLVIFNSEIVNCPKASGDEEQQQLAWLTTDLEQAAARKPTHIMVFSHHPIFVSSPDEPDAHGNLPLARRNIYLALLKKYGVTAVFSGHEHYNAIGRYGDTEMITTASLCKPFFGVAGFRIVKVYQDHIEHKFFTLQNPPSEVRLDGVQVAKKQATTRAEPPAATPIVGGGRNIVRP